MDFELENVILNVQLSRVIPLINILIALIFKNFITPIDNSIAFLLHARFRNSEKLEVFTFGWKCIGQGLSTESGVMSSLKVLSVSNCNLNGTLPIQGLLSLDYQLLKDNNFEIPISFESFANHSKLKYVIPDDNSLVVQSSVKSWIPKFQLEALSLTNNCSEMPNFLHYQRNLRQLSLSKCNTGGNFPNWLLENNTRLEEIYLDGNAFTGTLQLSFLPNLKTFDISNNKIQGQLPPNIGSVFPNM
ncbi:hypothetical protein CQW23_32860 [Capsicum baccatum]|uniref:Uncharacterized protein n=1 Tax=Capsicum baccatum TaxID=33114 RepID=A0A2G2V3H4_CAPBA|nr:hypothetical protein CQW23_32860 [Capsicum baccatum]